MPCAGAGACCACCAGGIFSLHERGGRLVTASKDGTVVVSSLGGTASLAAVQRYDELHEGVVKCARWREGGGTFASCGNDRSVCVVDTRQPPAAGNLPSWASGMCGGAWCRVARLALSHHGASCRQLQGCAQPQPPPALPACPLPPPLARACRRQRGGGGRPRQRRQRAALAPGRHKPPAHSQPRSSHPAARPAPPRPAAAPPPGPRGGRQVGGAGRQRRRRARAPRSAALGSQP